MIKSMQGSVVGEELAGLKSLGGLEDAQGVGRLAGLEDAEGAWKVRLQIEGFVVLIGKEV
jgi:hypothetical protein